ncbi:hypothetical protein [Streptomyces sp. NBC_00582]|uniref:hypothetical protein n=1 Tax=Streptomyces sp. NBC_00582 TaxID=2975783 RepID=UPI0010E994E3|nr:hypothetical protein [Streptomyces sp. NBC_00582]WUB64098.1 hypothetical protein OG852_28740 [Streptomyces sp. NBC_00582]
MVTTTRAQKRLEGGWFQRLAWAALGWFSLGLLVWVPFLYVALRRGRPSDWGACASFVLYECVTLPWAANSNDGDGDPFLGVAAVVTLLIATVLLLFWVFDKKTPTTPPLPAYGGQPYQQGYPYGR